MRFAVIAVMHFTDGGNSIDAGCQQQLAEGDSVPIGGNQPAGLQVGSPGAQRLHHFILR